MRGLSKLAIKLAALLLPFPLAVAIADGTGRIGSMSRVTASPAG